MVHLRYSVCCCSAEAAKVLQKQLSRWNYCLPEQGGGVHAGPPVVAKYYGRLPGVDLLLAAERVIVHRLLGAAYTNEVKRRQAGPPTLATTSPPQVHAAFSAGLLTNLMGSRVMLIVATQHATLLVVAAIVPYMAYQNMTSCEEGYPGEAHTTWGAVVALSGLCQAATLYVYAPEDSRGPFFRSFSLRLLLYVLAALLLQSDTYMDATFPVIARTCNFDLWKVSVVLIVGGIGLMQARRGSTHGSKQGHRRRRRSTTSAL